MDRGQDAAEYPTMQRIVCPKKNYLTQSISSAAWSYAGNKLFEKKSQWLNSTNNFFFFQAVCPAWVNNAALLFLVPSRSLADGSSFLCGLPPTQ